jgi:hypothetical protein
MKRLLVLIIGIVVANAAFAQTVWKERVVGKWAYAGTEEFGVVTPADSTHQTDLLELNADGSFRRVEKGNESKGTYTVDEAGKTMTLKDAAGKTKLYYLKKSEPGTLTVETQTPDLVRTRHRYTAASE